MTDLAALVLRVEELERARKEVAAERDAYHALYLEMMERCRKLERGLLGQKAERFAPSEGQLSFDVLSTVLAARDAAEIDALEEEEVQTVRAHERKKHPGRTPIAEHLPRVEIVVLPAEVEREGTDAFERIGEEVTEVIERRRASVVVARIVKPKFVRRGRARDAATEVLVAQTPPLPIERGRAGPGLLADTVVKRWQDSLPINRLESVYARDGFELSRSTMCGWHMELADLLAPLIAAMRADAFSAPYLCTDATGVLVQARKKCRRAHFWVLVAPQRHVLFEYTTDHTKVAVDRVLSGYEGHLVADAHVVYDHLYERGDVVEVNCRVGGGLTAPAPHRSGRAGFPHPVPHVSGSLVAA